MQISDELSRACSTQKLFFQVNVDVIICEAKQSRRSVDEGSGRSLYAQY